MVSRAPARTRAKLLRFSNLMTVAHPSGCGKEKLENRDIIPANNQRPGLPHYVRNDGILDCFTLFAMTEF